MITPVVTEIRRELDAVTPDPFLEWPVGIAHPASRVVEACGSRAWHDPDGAPGREPQARSPVLP